MSCKSEDLYRHLYESVPIPICVMDSNWNVTAVNKAFKEMFGIGSSDISSLQDWLESVITQPYQSTKLINKLKKTTTENGRRKLGKFELLNKNKIEKSLELHINSIENCFTITFKDYTDYKQIEAAIIKEKVFTENLINSFPGLFYLFKINGKKGTQLIRWNKNIEKHTGYTHKELANKSLLDFFDKPEQANIVQAVNYLIKEKEISIEANLLIKSGKTIPFEFMGKTFNDSGKQYFFGLGTDISDRKMAEFVAKESKLRYKQLSDLTFEGILIHENGIAIDMNEAFAKIFGYNIDELIGLNLIELLGDEEDKELMYRNMRSNSPYPYEVYAFRKSGEKFPAEITGREIYHDGRRARVISVRDISERKKREKELTEHQLLIQRITEQSPDIIYIFDVEKGRNVYINKDLRIILGYDKHSLPKSSTDIVSELIHPDDIQQFTDFYSTIEDVSKDFVFEFTYRLKAQNGEWRWFAGKEKEFQSRDGKIITMIGTLLEITTQKKYEQALLDSEEQLSTIFENAPLIMFLLGEDGTILKMNKNSILKKNNNKRKLIGDVLNCVNSFNKENNCGNSEHCDKCGINKIINNTFTKKRNYYKAEARLKVRQKEYSTDLFFLISTKLMRQGSSDIALITLDDITKQKLMEFDLKDAKEKAEENNKLKTAFLQNMSHEIRTPMNGIIGFSDMLSGEKISDEKRKLYTDVIVKSSKQLLNIVNDILDISKIETGQAEKIESETNINQLFCDLFIFYKPMAWKKRLNIFLNTPLDNQESFVWVDYVKLKQVLENLMSNALKFTHEGYIRFGYKSSSNELIFYMEDSGIGIEKKYHDKIFEQFRQIELTTTREYGGTGLGLAICKAYVNLLGGKLWLNSTKGKGSIFYFTIPYKPVLINENLGLIKTLQDKPLITRNKSILVAEDEFANYMLLNEILKDLDIKVLHAKNGEEAIEIVKRKNVSLALLDIKMPEMNGYEAVIEIKKIRPSLPVVAQTAFATSEDRDKILGAGFDDYLPKPIQKEALYEIVKKYLGIRA